VATAPIIIRQLIMPECELVVRAGEGIVFYLGKRRESDLAEVVNWTPAVDGVAGPELALGLVKAESGWH